MLLAALAGSTGVTPGLAAQGLLEQFSYENLKPSALQFDLGPLGGTDIKGTLTGGARLDYGLVAPRVRVLLGLSYFRAEFNAAARRRFEQRLRSIVNDPDSNFTIDLGRITWSDLTGDLDLQYMFPQGRSVTTYLGLGLGIHVRNGSGSKINGTIIEDALDGIAAAANGTIGAEFGTGQWRVSLDARGVLSSDLSTVSLRAGLVYRWAKPR